MATITKKNIAVICGSTRQNSTNYRFIKAIEALCENIFNITIFEGVASLPHFNPDDENSIDKEVLAFRQLLNDADGVLICTPEYAHGVPGTLKNAIDWVVGTSEFNQKPTALITAATDGTYAHKALLETLKVIEAKNIEHLQMCIQFAKTKIDTNNIITDDKTLHAVLQLIKNFEQTIKEIARD
jgi:chromate reductase, NAD(P)H dehydrogenase (quinone)